jgi:hypothetical protein
MKSKAPLPKSDAKRHARIRRRLKKHGFNIYIGIELAGRHDFAGDVTLGGGERPYFVSGPNGDAVDEYAGGMLYGGLTLDDAEQWLDNRLCDRRAAVLATKAKNCRGSD